MISDSPKFEEQEKVLRKKIKKKGKKDLLKFIRKKSSKFNYKSPLNLCTSKTPEGNSKENNKIRKILQLI